MMKKVVLKKIITLDDVVERDEKRNVETWILWKCDEAIKGKKFSLPWDGKTVEGEAVKAFVNNGRWGARCKVCSNPQYVSWMTKIFYCVECGNGGSTAAWPVEFPIDREQIEAELLKREVAIEAERLIRNVVELSLHIKPLVPGLARSWRPGISADQLATEREAKLDGGRK